MNKYVKSCEQAHLENKLGSLKWSERYGLNFGKWNLFSKLYESSSSLERRDKYPQSGFRHGETSFFLYLLVNKVSRVLGCALLLKPVERHYTPTVFLMSSHGSRRIYFQNRCVSLVGYRHPLFLTDRVDRVHPRERANAAIESRENTGTV